jgi:hypothetical protein
MIVRHCCPSRRLQTDLSGLSQALDERLAAAVVEAETIRGSLSAELDQLRDTVGMCPLMADWPKE